MTRRSAFVLLISFLVLIPATAMCQQACSTPEILRPSSSSMFNLEQESYLGDVLSQSVLMDFEVIEDEGLTKPLDRIAERLAGTVSGEKPKFRVSIVDAPFANAFTFAGGRIYITRKAITLSRNEDEIAGVLAHEMGHQLTGQFGRQFSELWRAVLKVNSVGDRNSIEEQYHTFLDTLARQPKVLKSILKESDRDQIEADHASIALTRAAGYSSAAFADYFDRLADNHHDTGNWFRDMVGVTKPDARRFREILKSTATLAQDCVEKGHRMSPEEFATWRRNVTIFSGFGKRESLPGGSTKLELKDPLRAPIRRLRFSPDGVYVLAQDESSIFVLTREPFKALFRIDAEGAADAKFTPDSKNIVFHTTEALRVEKWNIEQQQRTEVEELFVSRGCWQSVLSPTGEYLACVHANGKDEKMQLSLFSVQNGELIYEKRNLYFASDVGFYLFGIRNFEMLEFSPDGRYLLGENDNDVAYDVQKREVLKLTKVRKYTESKFAWLSADTLVGHQGTSKTSAIVKFPGGEVLRDDLPFSVPQVTAATKANILILRPIIHAALGLFDLKTNSVLMGSKLPAIDVYDDVLVEERDDGILGLFKLSAPNTQVASAELPLGPAAALASISVSPNLNYIAYSDNLRGALWHLHDGVRVKQVRGFRGGYFFNENELFAIFPPEDSYLSNGFDSKEDYENRDRKSWQVEELNKPGASVARLTTMAKAFLIANFPKRINAWQHGPYLLVSPYAAEDGELAKERELEVRDIRTSRKLWSRKFPNTIPRMYFNASGDSLAFVWPFDSQDGKSIVKKDAALQAKVDAIEKAKKSALIVEVLSHQTGDAKFVVPVDTGERSFLITDVDAVGGTVAFSDTYGRVVLYNSKGDARGGYLVHIQYSTAVAIVLRSAPKQGE